MRVIPRQQWIICVCTSNKKPQDRVSCINWTSTINPPGSACNLRDQSERNCQGLVWVCFINQMWSFSKYFSTLTIGFKYRQKEKQNSSSCLLPIVFVACNTTWFCIYGSICKLLHPQWGNVESLKRCLLCCFLLATKIMLIYRLRGWLMDCMPGKWWGKKPSDKEKYEQCKRWWTFFGTHSVL